MPAETKPASTRERVADALAQLLLHGLLPMHRRMEATAALGLVYDDVNEALARHRQRGYCGPGHDDASLTVAPDPAPPAAPKRGRPQRTDTALEKAKIVAALKGAGGVVTDRYGQATRRLHELMDTSASMQSLTMRLKDLDRAGVIRRDVRAVRTYRIELVDTYDVEVAS